MHPGRVQGDLAVSRSLGDVSLQPYVTSNPFINSTKLGEDVECLIMACDGLWDMMSDQLAVDIVLACPDPRLSATALRDRAFLSGSTDNISVLTIFFSSNGGKASAARREES